MTLPLQGLLVVDLTRAVAGPFCTMLMGDMGARIIKVEEPKGGDETRQWGPPFVHGWSTYYLSVNRNKESIALDLKSEAGREALRRLAAKADVVIENFRPGVVDRLGVGYRQLAGANPRLIYCSISGFGQTGPWRDKPGYDLIIQAMSGSMHTSGTPEQGPVKVAFPAADVLAALFAGNAILAALFARERTGQGRYIEISLLEGMLAAMSNLATAFLATGEEPHRAGTAQPNIVPYQVFRCSDGLVAVGAANERLWQRLCDALERPEWRDDPRFRTNGDRNVHRAELVAMIEAVLAARPAAHWLARMESHEVPCGPVSTMGQILNHPALAARNAIAAIPHPDFGTLRLVANPIRFEGVEYEYRRPPLHGEHTEAILREIAEDRSHS